MKLDHMTYTVEPSEDGESLLLTILSYYIREEDEFTEHVRGD